MNIGLIDLGSNSIRLVIYHYGDGQLTKLFNLKHAAKSILYVKDNKMSIEGVEVIVSSLKELIFVARTYHLDYFRIFATASLRNIDNSKETIAAIESSIHHPIELLSDHEESAYGFEAVVKVETLPKEGLSIDIGGGSMEITYFVDGKLIHTTSIPVGSLNFYQQYVSNVLPNDAEQNLMRAHARTIFSNIVWLENKMIDHIIGIGGTSRAMVKMNKVLDFEKNTSLSYNTISKISRLNPVHAQDIIKGAPDRLITLVPGAILIDELMQYVHATTFTASKASLREGYLYHKVLQEG